MNNRAQAVGIIRRELIDNPNDIDGLASDIFDALSAAHLIAGGGEAVGYIREESRESLATGGHGIEGTVPLHAQQTRWATIPVYACPAPALTAGVAGDSVNAAFDQWYARQRHQLTNEQVCRLIWTRGWEACAASPPDAPTPSPGYVLVRENDWLARLSHGEALVNAVLAPTAGVGESIHERIAENFDGNYLSGFKEIDSFEKWTALVRRLLEAYERMRASPPATDGWLPIDSAPEDTDIIIFAKPDWVGEAHYYTDDETGGRIWTWATAGPVHENHTPAAWQPLPAPPTDAGGE